MKLIDEKGRLFGKLNIIDLLIVAIILLGLFGVNYKLGFLKKIGPTTTSQQKPIVKMWIKNVSPFVSNSVTVGDTLRELSSNSEIGKVLAVEVKPAKDIASDSNGKWIISEVPERNEVFITMEAAADKINNNVKLGSKDAKSGAGVELKGTKFQATAYVIGVE